jgi:c-di-GMP-binding flagellar brake protein YcgR
MGIERRRFPRVKAELRIGYEFVSWRERNLNKMINPTFSKIFDISASGIGLYNLSGLTERLLKQLEKGKKKIRLALYLNEEKPPLFTFARLIWSNYQKDYEGLKRYGFVFLDVSQPFFEEVKSYVDKHLDKK